MDSECCYTLLRNDTLSSYWFFFLILLVGFAITMEAHL